jgi:hypothetical protein
MVSVTPWKTVMYENTPHEKLNCTLADAGAESQRASPRKRATPGVLVVVEGPNDIEFLRRISRISHLDDPTMADLAHLEAGGHVVFVPFCGGSVPDWSYRLAAVGWSEFHLYDREMPPETEIRQRAAAVVNARPGCQATLTSRRSLENYLHPSAIEDAAGVTAVFSKADSVAEVVARACLPEGVSWNDLSVRTHRRLRYRAKRWLNTIAVDQMTPARLAEQDPAGEVESWIHAIARLAR